MLYLTMWMLIDSDPIGLKQIILYTSMNIVTVLVHIMI